MPALSFALVLLLMGRRYLEKPIYATEKGVASFLRILSNSLKALWLYDMIAGLRKNGAGFLVFVQQPFGDRLSEKRCCHYRVNDVWLLTTKWQW